MDDRRTDGQWTIGVTISQYRSAKHVLLIQLLFIYLLLTYKLIFKDFLTLYIIRKECYP